MSDHWDLQILAVGTITGLVFILVSWRSVGATTSLGVAVALQWLVSGTWFAFRYGPEYAVRPWEAR